MPKKIQKLMIGAAALMITSGGLVAQERAGITLKVQPDSFQAIGSVGTALGVRDEIYRDARVYTKQYGSMDIQLEDGTSLVISPNSSLVIDEYVYAGAGSPGSLAISLSRGAMRMVSGKMAKPSYSIKTPIATIGVRGTSFTLDVNEQKTDVWVDEGVVETSVAGQLYELVAPAFASCGAGGCEVGPPPPVPATYPENASQPDSNTEPGIDQNESFFDGFNNNE